MNAIVSFLLQKAWTWFVVSLSVDIITHYVQHMHVKHPKAYRCGDCRHRIYRSLSALREHYRGSAKHPNCSQCGVGCRDENALNEHVKTKHSGAWCRGCEMFEDLPIQENHAKSSIRLLPGSIPLKKVRCIIILRMR
jgi:hypothetical protein